MAGLGLHLLPDRRAQRALVHQGRTRGSNTQPRGTFIIW